MFKRRPEMTRSLMLLAAIMILSSVNCQVEMTGSVENKTGTNESRPRVFSPRMDYDEWTPLGRGDPLKNDPTFDYVPPVLDRVQYWLDSHTTEPSAKRDILVLGVTAKKTSPKIPEQFLKFVDGPKFNRNQDQQYRNEHVIHRNDFTGSTGAEPPKIMRNTNFRNGAVDYRNHNRIQHIPASYYPSPFYNQKPKPYTMMLPPPVVPKPDGAQPTYTPQNEKLTYAEQNQQFSTQTEEGPLQDEHHTYNAPLTSYSQPHNPPRNQQASSNPPPVKNQISQIESINSVFTPPAQTTKQKFQTVTTPSVSFEKSNLVYHSTQTVSGGWLANEGPSSDINQVTWQPPVSSQEHFESGDHHVAASSSHEVVIGQNANIIVDGDSADNSEVVVGKKESSSQENVAGPTSVPSTNSVQTSMLKNDDSDSDEIVVGQPPSSSKMEMQIVVANTGFENSKPNEPVAVIMPTNYMKTRNDTVNENGVETTNVTPENNQNTVTSVIEQSIQISNPLPQPITVTNPPTVPPHHANQMNYINQPNQINKIPHIGQMNQMNQMHQMNHMNRMNQIPPRPIFSQSNAQPLMQHSLNSEHSIMSQMLNAGKRHHLAGMSSMQQQMFNVPPGHMMQPQRPNGMEYLAMNSMVHRVQTPTTPRVDMVRDHPYHMQDTSKEGVPILPTPQPPVLKPESVTASLDSVTDYIKNQSPLAHLLNNELNKAHQPSPSTTPPTTTTTSTTVSSLTTDPIFSHYKQPAKPIRGPMYLIIQGHSKVKTYKPSVTKYGFPVDNNEIQEASTERPSKLEQLIIENTRSRSPEKSSDKVNEEVKPRQKRIEQEDLLSLVDSNFSGFTVRPAPAIEEERQSNSVTTIEINN